MLLEGRKIAQCSLGFMHLHCSESRFNALLFIEQFRKLHSGILLQQRQHGTRPVCLSTGSLLPRRYRRTHWMPEWYLLQRNWQHSCG